MGAAPHPSPSEGGRLPFSHHQGPVDGPPVPQGAGEGRVGALCSPGLCRGSWEADLLNVLWETGMPLAAASGRIASFTEL